MWSVTRDVTPVSRAPPGTIARSADASDDVLAVPRARRHPRRPAARVGAVDRAGRRRSRSGPARYGFDLVITPIFEHLEVFQRVGESTDVVRKEMYDFEDKGGRRIALRPEGTARRRARVRPAPPGGAVEGLVRRAALPLRAAAEGSQPPALAGGRGGARASTTPSSTSRSSRSPHGFYRALGLRDVHPEHQLDGRRGRPAPRTSVCCASTSSRMRGTLGDDLPRAGRGQSAARARLEGPRLAGRDRARAADHRAARRRARGRTSRRCSAVSTGSASPTRSTRGSCAGSTTTPAPRSSSAARRSTRRRTASAAAVATTSSSSRWAGSPRRASGSASASSACSSRARRRASIPGQHRRPTSS